jgi:hypothetical protein
VTLLEQLGSTANKQGLLAEAMPSFSPVSLLRHTYMSAGKMEIPQMLLKHSE